MNQNQPRPDIQPEPPFCTPALEKIMIDLGNSCARVLTTFINDCKANTNLSHVEIHSALLNVMENVLLDYVFQVDDDVDSIEFTVDQIAEHLLRKFHAFKAIGKYHAKTSHGKPATEPKKHLNG